MSLRTGFLPRWEEMTSLERDRAYDNIAAVADGELLQKRRLELSNRFRASHPELLDLPYATRPNNKWDIYRGQLTSPSMIFIHGGYWQRNDRQGFAFVAEGLHRCGWSIALPGYTLAPSAKLQEIVSEVGSALDWFGRARSVYGLGSPVVLAGWSAGATLALLHADHPVVDSVLGVSGLYELEPLRETALNIALNLSGQEIAEFSPLRRHPISRPTQLAVGAAELPALLTNSQAMFAHLRSGKGWADLEILERRNHFNILDEFSTPQGQLVEAAHRLVAKLSQWTLPSACP